MAVYRDYEQAGLDAQYNLRQRHADALDLIEEGSQWSARTRETLKCELDIAYGPADGERLDVFLADKPGRPIQVFIHGGYWQRLDKADYSFVAEGFVPAGANVVTVNYDLAPKVSMDEIVRQVRGSLAWVWRNARDFGADRDRLHVSGHSAGGHLTAMMAMTDWTGFERGLPSDLVKGGCAISGLHDLEAIRLCYLNEVLQMDAAEARRNSPVHMTPPTEVPMILAVGAEETDEFLRQQADLADSLTGQGAPPQILELAGLNHFTVILDFAKEDSALNQAVRTQMRI